MEKQEQLIVELVAKRKFSELIQHCEEIELDAAAEMTNAVPPYSVMLLCYMVVNDLDSCRFLWKRIPNPVQRKKDLLLQSIWVIGKNLWSRNYEGTFAAISAYRSAFGTPSVHSTLVDILYEEFVARTKQLIATTYQSISVKQAASLLGLSESDASKLWPEQDGYLYPVLPTKPLELTTTQNIVSVAEFAVHLETDISTFGLKHNAPTGKGGSQATKGGASVAGKK